MKKLIRSVIIMMVALAAVWFIQPSAYGGEDLRLTISRTDGNVLHINWPFETGAYYLVMSSTNLKDWQTDAAVPGGIDGIFPGEMARFYRVQKLQPITIGAGTLSAANGAMPGSAILTAGGTNIWDSRDYVAQFTLSASNQSFTVNQLRLKVTGGFALSVVDVAIEYKDRAGAHQSAYIFGATEDLADRVVAFTNLTLYVPANGDARLDVYIVTRYLSFAGIPGAAGAITLLANKGFSATGDSGTVVTSAGPSNLTGNTFYIRQIIPTFTKLDAGTDPVNGPLYRFSVVANRAGFVHLKQLGFKVAAIGCEVSGLYLYDPATLTVLTDVPVDPINGIVKLPVGKIGDNDIITVSTIPKTLEVWGMVTGYGQAGDSISVAFMEDWVAAPNSDVNGAVASGAYNIWSDSWWISWHTVFTSTWCNGYLLKDMSQTQTFSR